MNQLIKTTGIDPDGERTWKYEINPDYYALSFHPASFVMCRNGNIHLSHGTSKIPFNKFREAIESLVNVTVARYYRSIPRPSGYTREEMAEFQRLK
jgi:hypothetical protein